MMEGRLKTLESRMTKMFIGSLISSLLLNPVITVAVLSLSGRAYVREPMPPHISTGNHEINLGGAADSGPGTQRIFLTTAELAARERIAERTALQWISDGRVLPPPVKTERSWVIAADYRILPPTAALSSNAAP